jgi:hypothetical protein
MSVSREEGMKIRSYFNQTEELNLQQLQTEMVINASEFERFNLAILSSPTLGNFYHLCFCVKVSKRLTLSMSLLSFPMIFLTHTFTGVHESIYTLQ